MRQVYRNAVNRGTRSGSGRIVQENYEVLAEIWGGPPATIALSFGVDGDSVLNTEDDSLNISTETDAGSRHDGKCKKRTINMTCVSCQSVSK